MSNNHLDIARLQFTKKNLDKLNETYDYFINHSITR
jgi:hypothetical protein